MKSKLIAVLISVAALFIGAVLWRTDSFIYGDRMSWVEAQTRTQLGAINHSLLQELKSLDRVVSALGVENFEKGKVNWGALSPYYAVAAFNVRGKDLEPQTIVAKESSKAANWSLSFVKSALGSIGEQSKELRYFIKPFQDSQGGRYVAFLFLNGTRASAVFGSGEIFQALIDAQKGSLSSFSVVTSSGLTVGHSIPEYLGTMMRDDPVFLEAQGSGSTHGSAVLKVKSGQELYGMFEVVPQSNLFVLSSAPLSEAMKGRSGLMWQFLLLGMGLMLVGAAGALWVIAPAEKVIESLEKRLEELRLKPAPKAVPEKTAVLEPEMIHKDRMEASMSVASALAHEMRGPLASILGYSQMILARSTESEIVQNTNAIVRETRAARSVLDKLLDYAGEEVKEKNSMKVEGPLARALKLMDPVFSEKGVKIIRNFQETSVIDLRVDAVAKALHHILENSVEAMERMAKKEITLDLFEDVNGIHLNIADTGEGIEPANIEKVFDPFFTTRSFQHHMGLGLSVAFGILKEHNAEVRIESERGRGTRLEILFHKSDSQSVMKAPQPEVKAEEEEEMIVMKELPRLPEVAEPQLETAPAPEIPASIETPLPSSAVAASPLDVNIENLLEELPEVHEVKSEVVEKVVGNMITKKKVIPNDDELTFIDGFLADEVEEAPADHTQQNMLVLGESSLSDTAENLEVDSDEFVAEAGVNAVAAPKGISGVKASKLDGYQVQIRRPGKRI